MKGRKPTPTAVRRLRGNPQRRPFPADEPEPAPVAGTVEAPAWLDVDAQAEWRRVAPTLARNGVLTEMDVDALTAYCAAWTTWKTATQKIRSDGLIVTSPNGHLIQSPYLPIANRAMLHLRALMIEFGMTPSARARVRSSAAPAPAGTTAPPADPFSKFDTVSRGNFRK